MSASTHSTAAGVRSPVTTPQGAGAPLEAPDHTRSRLISRRDALPKGSRHRAALDERIRQATHAMLAGQA